MKRAELATEISRNTVVVYAHIRSIYTYRPNEEDALEVHAISGTGGHRHETSEADRHKDIEIRIRVNRAQVTELMLKHYCKTNLVHIIMKVKHNKLSSTVHY